jgi:hypothetical protein
VRTNSEDEKEKNESTERVLLKRRDQIDERFEEKHG